MTSDQEGFWYPQIDETRCVNCGLCEKACPILTPHSSSADEEIVAYAAMHKNDAIRLNSSSGGIFSALATYVIEKGGVVFGAAFDENFNVVHTYVECVDKLEILRGSKYVQSKIGNAYRQAEEFLKSGRLVLFSGTPCQIEGLLSYLRKPYENLITQDLICHGVPSPMVWQKYVEYRQSVSGAKPREISFRAKNEGWKRYSVSFLFKNNKEYQLTRDKDFMMQAFLKNLCLRPSCYYCSFKRKNRRSDITLADFWGVNKVMPNMDDDKGTSLVILHSNKGREILAKIDGELKIAEIDIDTAISHNLSMIKSVEVPKTRDQFLITAEKGFMRAANKYLKITLLQKIKRKLIRILKSIRKRLKKKNGRKEN